MKNLYYSLLILNIVLFVFGACQNEDVPEKGLDIKDTITTIIIFKDTFPVVDTNIIDTMVLNYPTRLYKLDSFELAQLQAKTPYGLDKFGLFDHQSFFPSGNSSITDKEIVIANAKQFLVENSNYSNVLIESTLVAKSAKQPDGPGDDNQWAIVFRNQYYKGLEVVNSPIIVIIFDTVTCVEGHHYKDIFIPTSNLLAIDTIKARLVGKKIKYYDICCEQERIITSNLIVNQFVKKIFYKEFDNYIEFYTVWKIPILYEEVNSWIGWYVFVDVITGETIDYYPTFIAK